MLVEQQNWSGNYTFRAARWHTPATVDQVQKVVAGCRKLRAVGTRHSFNDIADSPDDVILLAQLNRVVGLDRERQTVTVEAGMRYGELAQYLHAAGFALHNLASLPHISVAGACQTATHGSGVGNGNLATAVVALELITADGDVVTLSRAEHGDQFAGMVVSLGSLGVVTKLTLKIEPTFAVRQFVYENLPLAALADHFDEIMASAYSVSLFTEWRSDQINKVWLKQRVAAHTPPDVAASLFGATLATREHHPIDSEPADNCTPQLGVAGPWHERLPHFRLDHTPSSGAELQSEYFVPREHGVAALHALNNIRDQIAPLLMVSEIRTIAADDLWLSPCYGRACVGVHFTWHRDWPAVQQVLPLIEDALAPFGVRPHWGKLFTMSPAAVQANYSKLPEFQRLLGMYDPAGKFRNEFMNTYLF